MQSRDQMEDLIFDHNDRARELSQATDFLIDQLALMNDSGALTDEERRLNREAQQAVGALHDAIEERATREMFEDAETERIAEYLDNVHDLSVDIMSELEEHTRTIDRTGWPAPNPYDVAEDSGYQAQEFADDIRHLSLDEDADERYAIINSDGKQYDIVDDEDEALALTHDREGWSIEVIDN